MGVETITTYKYTCDLCKSECDAPDEGEINIVTQIGQRDCGPSTLSGRLYYNEDYGVQDGIICTKCKIQYLEQYVADLKNRRVK